MKRITLFAKEETLTKLKHMAKNEDVSMAELIRKALKNFVSQKQQRNCLPSFVGIGSSGRRDISENVDKLLWADSPLARRHKKRNA